MSAATPRVLDMAESYRTPEKDERPVDERDRLLTGKQQRARIRRRLARMGKKFDETIGEGYVKPFEEWDNEEVARGRPRGADGTFRGRAPRYIDRALHEKAMERFKGLVREDMNALGLEALQVMQRLLSDDEEDGKGKPRVPATVKIQAATYLLDHIVGKPTQPTTSEISVKLQAMLGAAVVNPAEDGGYVAGQVAFRGALPGEIEAEVIDDEDEEDYGGGE